MILLKNHLNIEVYIFPLSLQRTSSISDCPISHASQLANPFLGLPLEMGKCESCGTAEPGKCEGMLMVDYIVSEQEGNIVFNYSSMTLI